MNTGKLRRLSFNGHTHDESIHILSANNITFLILHCNKGKTKRNTDVVFMSIATTFYFTGNDIVEHISFEFPLQFRNIVRVKRNSMRITSILGLVCNLLVSTIDGLRSYGVSDYHILVSLSYNAITCILTCCVRIFQRLTNNNRNYSCISYISISFLRRGLEYIDQEAFLESACWCIHPRLTTFLENVAQVSIKTLLNKLLVVQHI